MTVQRPDKHGGEAKPGAGRGPWERDEDDQELAARGCCGGRRDHTKKAKLRGEAAQDTGVTQGRGRGGTGKAHNTRTIGTYHWGTCAAKRDKTLVPPGDKLPKGGRVARTTPRPA